MDQDGWRAVYYQQAEAMRELVEKSIATYKADPVTPRILIFTGHSGGGAIAQILYYFAVWQNREKNEIAKGNRCVC